MGSSNGKYTCDIRLKPVKQEHRLTCWAACARMILGAASKNKYNTDKKICDLVNLGVEDRGSGGDILAVITKVCGAGPCYNGRMIIKFSPIGKGGKIGTATRFQMDDKELLEIFKDKWFVVVVVQGHAVIFDEYTFSKANVMLNGIDPQRGERIEASLYALKTKGAEVMYSLKMSPYYDEL